MMSKFNEGDRVRVVNKDEAASARAAANPDYYGKTGTITIGRTGVNRVRFDDGTDSPLAGGTIGTWSDESLVLLDRPHVWQPGDRVFHKTVKDFGTVDSIPDPPRLDREIPVRWDDKGVINALPSNLISEADRLKQVSDEENRSGLDALISGLHSSIHEARADADTQSARAERAEGQVDTLTHELARANERVEEFRSRNWEEFRAHVRASATGDFARSLLDDIGRAKVEGFVEGLTYF